MNALWIKENGSILEINAAELIRKYRVEGKTCLAFFSDHFETVPPNDVVNIMSHCEKLLELRIFDAKSELRMCRSTLGQPFFWRIADDGILKNNVQTLADPFLQNVENHFIKEIQYLEGTEKGRAAAQLSLQAEENAVEVIVYIRYDENGVAAPADYRLVGFTVAKTGD